MTTLELDILGYTAGTLISVSMFPQIYKTIKTKSAKDLSLTRYVIYTISVILWVWYGFELQSAPMIFTNLLSLGCSLTLLGLIIKSKFNW